MTARVSPHGFPGLGLLERSGPARLGLCSDSHPNFPHLKGSGTGCRAGAGGDAAAIWDKSVSLERLFPCYGYRVFVYGCSGTLRVPQGRWLASVHMGCTRTCERDLMQQIARGVLGGTWMRYNALPPGITQ